MRTLERFWHWFTGEKPPADRARAMLDKNVSSEGRNAVDIAAGFIDCHANGGYLGHRPFIDQALARHPEALRDLSLALCPALARMRQQVPGYGHAPKPKPLPASKVTAHYKVVGEGPIAQVADSVQRVNERLADSPSERACCSMHGTFYGGCMGCQQARFRAQRDERAQAQRAPVGENAQAESIWQHALRVVELPHHRDRVEGLRALQVQCERLMYIRTADHIGDLLEGVEDRRRIAVARARDC